MTWQGPVQKPLRLMSLFFQPVKALGWSYSHTVVVLRRALCWLV